ncbi:MAG: hypothetical protein AAB249_10340, partial [Acidobacteriota bacterium]
TRERVAILPAGGSTVDAVAERSTAGAVDGRVVFSTARLAPAAYEAALIDDAGAIVSRSPFWLYAPGTPAIVTTAKSEYRPGEDIRVSWANAPGMRWDWLGIYKPGDSDGSPQATSCDTYNCGGNQRYLLYEYTRAAIEGTTTFTAASAPGWVTWPLAPGMYEIRLLLDDGYRSIAASEPFRIVGP